MCSKHVWKIWIRRRSIRISRRRQPARHVRHMTAAAASRPAVTGMPRWHACYGPALSATLCERRVNCMALRQRPNNLCVFSWYVMDNGRDEERNIAITDVRAPDGASVYFTTWDETAPRPHRTPPSRRGIKTCAMRWGPWSRVTEHSTALETGTPVTSFRQGQRGTPHHGRKNRETPFRSEVSLALFKIVFCR